MPIRLGKIQRTSFKAGVLTLDTYWHAEKQQHPNNPSRGVTYKTTAKTKKTDDRQEVRADRGEAGGRWLSQQGKYISIIARLKVRVQREGLSTLQPTLLNL